MNEQEQKSVEKMMNIPTPEELQKAILGPVVRVPQMVIDALNAIREAGIALEARIDVLEATTDNISEATEREILYAMIEDNSKDLSGMSQQIHGLRLQLQTARDKAIG